MFYSNFGVADSRFPTNFETYSSYWTTTPSGPRTKNDFINMFLKGRELDIIEGIWMESGYGIVGITKQGSDYKKYLISVNNIFDGTIESTYFSTAGPKVFSAMIRIEFPKGDDYVYGTSTGTLLVENENYIKGYIDRYAVNKNFTLIRQWPKDLYAHNKKINPNTEEFEGKKELGDLVSGSGFFISKKGYIITNAHVIKGCKSNKKITNKGNSANFKVIAKDNGLDLALLKAEIDNRHFLKISKDDIGKVEKVIVAGYPLGKFLSDDLKFTEGIVSSLKGFKGSTHEMQIDAAINQGNSGGPVVNEYGELVGVAVATLSKEITEGINFAIKSSALDTFLKSNSAKSSKASFSWGSMDRKDLRKHLENTTVYISCKI